MTKTNTMKITIDPIAYDALDPRTIAARYDDPRVGRWVGHTQTWGFENGDAIVVVGNYPECWAVIRVGDTVKVCDLSGGGGVLCALRSYFGIEVKNAIQPVKSPVDLDGDSRAINDRGGK